MGNSRGRWGEGGTTLRGWSLAFECQPARLAAALAWLWDNYMRPHTQAGAAAAYKRRSMPTYYNDTNYIHGDAKKNSRQSQTVGYFRIIHSPNLAALHRQLTASIIAISYCITHLESWYSFYRPMEGRRLSRPMAGFIPRWVLAGRQSPVAKMHQGP